MKKEIFDLRALSGNWESVNLNPTIIINQDRERFLLNVIHINEATRQASPATYEIQEDEDGFFINYNLKRASISYDSKQDVITLAPLGDYLRN